MITTPHPGQIIFILNFSSGGILARRGARLAGLMRGLRIIGNYEVNGEGKFLWEILSQLRGFGRGRMVTKDEWRRKFPKQPSYLIIKQVCYTVSKMVSVFNKCMLSNVRKLSLPMTISMQSIF